MILVEAAVIDGLKLRVPNWLTFHLIIGGLAFAAWRPGTPGFVWAWKALLWGWLYLLPLYAIGGMGAGDVKLLAGVGAWVGPVVTFWAFATSAVTGAVIAMSMVAWSGDYIRHWVQLSAISHEIMQHNAVLGERLVRQRRRVGASSRRERCQHPCRHRGLAEATNDRPSIAGTA